MNNITRLHQGPYPTPRPGSEELQSSYEDIRVGKARLAAAAAAVAAIALVGTAVRASHTVFSKPPSIEHIKEDPIKAKADDFDPKNSDIPTSGNEHQ